MRRSYPREGDDMTTLREAALMALGALEYIDSPLHVREIDKVGKAIAALDAALEQPEHTEQPLEMVATCKECLPVEREPVAWRTFDGEGGYDFRYYQDDEEYQQRFIERNGEQNASWVEPLYTAPPPREWQGLTDEEIDKVTDAQWSRNNHKPMYAAYRAYARAIEAKLKEKNA
jgi:hypothetical protein